MSYTRKRFLERKKAARDQRLKAEYDAVHTFWCKGLRRRRGIENQPCKHEVFFKEEIDKAVASCRFCKQIHIFSELNRPGMYKGWYTKEQYDELYIPDESLLVVEDVQKELTREKRTPVGTPVMTEKIILVDHAPWCTNKDVPLIGLTAQVGGSGRVMWRDSQGHFPHTCLSSMAASRMGKLGGRPKHKMVTRKGKAR